MKFLIIGGVAGGASAAARLRRNNEQAEIIMFEKGEYVSFANCGLPYYIGKVIKKRSNLLLQTPKSFKNRFNIDVRILQEVIKINPEEKTVQVKNLETGEIYTEQYDKLILSPGADPVVPPLPGIKLPGIFTLRNVPDTDKIKEYIEQTNAKKAVVIGAGFIGLEMAENLHHLSMDVSIVEMLDQVLAPVDYPIAATLQKHIREKGIHLLLDTAVTGFEKTENGITVNLKDKTSLEADMVILSIGVRPETGLAIDAGLKIGNAKGIFVNEFLQTSDENIYAVGDAIEFTNPITGNSMITYLAGPANKQGRIVANNIAFGNKEKYNGAINTAIVKVFDMTAGTTGMASKHLDKAGITHLVSTTQSGSHAGYYPHANNMMIQITFSPLNGQLYGAQIAGFDGVDKRLDIFSLIIKNKGTIYDLMEFEHSYAPPFSSAKDPVNMAGFVADNILNESVKMIHWDELPFHDESFLYIDVRTKSEYEKSSIQKAINIPVDELRERIDEIPKDKTLIIFCQIGLRGYIAHRILKQSGYRNLYNISGGYSLLETCTSEKLMLN
jgi:NADPH-dependent 2,4-dienoyl-CoA reductase/sulfur reductase-like enzyme/rhodanese-related sulfurtransferase